MTEAIDIDTPTDPPAPTCTTPATPAPRSCWATAPGAGLRRLT